MRIQSLIITFLFALIVLVNVQSQTPSQNEPALSYGLLIDNSGSLRKQLNQILDTSKFIVSKNQPGDETFIIRFTDRKNIKRIQDLTHDKEVLSDAIDTIYPEGGQTAILDALYESAQYLAQNTSNDTARRRVLVLISDGEDRASQRTLADILPLAREKKIQIYVLGFIAQLEKDKGKNASQKAVAFLTSLADETGGKAFFPKNLNELKANADELLNIIHMH